MRVVFFCLSRDWVAWTSPRKKGMRTTTEDLKLANLQKLGKTWNNFSRGVTVQEPPHPVPRTRSYKIRVDGNRMTAWLELYPAVGGRNPRGSFGSPARPRTGAPPRRSRTGGVPRGTMQQRRDARRGKRRRPPRNASHATRPRFDPLPVREERTRSYETDTDQAVDLKKHVEHPPRRAGRARGDRHASCSGDGRFGCLRRPVPAVPAKDLGIVYSVRTSR